ncbi:MAG: NYN domain-containing protein [Dehalococcoidales bacterium]
MTTGALSPDRQIAVLVDVENVGLSSIPALFEKLADVGRITVKKAYADWSSAGNRRDQLLELGIEPIQVFHASPSGKNSSDIKLATDAVDLLYTSPVDTFVIVSSDSDFMTLVSRLRAAGKTVIGAGPEETAPRALVNSCDRYIYLQDPSSSKRRRRRSPKPGGDVDALLARAIVASFDDQGRVFGSKLRQTLQRLDPSFDFRSLGFSTFTKFLQASRGVKVTRSKDANDVTVELVEAQTAAAVPAAAEATDGGHVEGWDAQIDAAWAKRAEQPGDAIPGPNAAADAARHLNVSKLSATRYRTLQALLDGSETLRARWRRDGNRIIRK